ncbi:MAG: LysM peptidoglycan-binding domain-containing protein [Steroidobacteraceae bacterium]
MFFNQELRVGLATGLISLGFAVAGCASHRAVQPAEAPQAAAPTAAQSPSSDAGQTATEAAISHADDGAASAAAGGSAPDEPALTRAAIKPGAPMRYTVKRGDTLWGISTMFLRDPWMWPEIWYDNPQIANPHRIYPGDLLVLAYGADGRPQIHVERGDAVRLEPRLRSTPLDGSIPTIPYSAIAAFLSRPTILSAAEVARAPHVLAFRDDHQAGGTGNEVYVRGIDAPVGARFTVIHIADKLRDPDDRRLLGYEGLYTATAVVERPGDPAKLQLLDSERETLRGDVLFAESGSTPLNFVPRAPTQPVRGRIITVIDDVHLIGQYNIVAINRGTRQGVDAGTVLAVDQAGQVVNDRGPASYNLTPSISTSGHGYLFPRRVRLPEERAGTLLVFKAFDRMSYALVVGASEQMRVADIVRNP